MALTEEAKKELLPSYCLVLLERGLEKLRQRDLTAARQLFEVAWQGVQKLPREDTEGLLPLAMCCRSLLEERRGNPIEATELRKRAAPLVEEIPPGKQDAPFLYMMGSVLADLGEHLRAVPFYERAAEQMVEKNLPLVVAELLEREGVCYSRSGLKEHAAVPLRAALKILREYPGEPRLPTVLISLGNALRKSAPAEAEDLYKEAAGIYEAKAQLESATAPWANLGVLCSEQGRHAESIAYYEQVLKVRQGRPGTPPARIALVLNNMACARRRMGDLDEALRLVDRALAVQSNDSQLLASMYGTRGQILHDAGRDEEALEWLRKSSAERRKKGSPDLDALEEILKFEIECLKRLGRVREAVEAEAELRRMREAAEAAPQSSVELGGLKPDAEGAVLVELAFGSRPGNRYSSEDAKIAGQQLGVVLAEKGVGKYAGRVAIPESVTLLYHGNDAEAMYTAMRQFLEDHCIFEGAMVSIRQGKTVRQVVMAQRVN
ncbi:MAG TPA: tetratricopeptide repeat protein [Terracidiphilus sp.]